MRETLYSVFHILKRKLVNISPEHIHFDDFFRVKKHGYRSLTNSLHSFQLDGDNQ
jgi:hypothetical protein